MTHIDAESREIIVRTEPSSAFAVERSPDTVLEEAHRAAAALKTVLDQKPKKVMMNDEQYLEFEDWITLGRFYGVTAREDGDAEYVTFGDVRGFRASAVAINRDGDVISRATAYCLTDEEKWGSRPKYAYGYVLKDGGWSEDPGTDKMVWEPNPNKTGSNRPKKERRQIGTESVPLFQLSSMAQTRACAKALRNVLSWVAVLAGYRPTPAEEIADIAEATVAPQAAPVASKPAAKAKSRDIEQEAAVEGQFSEADEDAIPFDPNAPLLCSECQAPLVETKFKDGTVWSPATLAELGQKKFGRVLDMACYRKENEALKRTQAAV